MFPFSRFPRHLYLLIACGLALWAAGGPLFAQPPATPPDTLKFTVKNNTAGVVELYYDGGPGRFTKLLSLEPYRESTVTASPGMTWQAREQTTGKVLTMPRPTAGATIGLGVAVVWPAEGKPSPKAVVGDVVRELNVHRRKLDLPEAEFNQEISDIVAPHSGFLASIDFGKQVFGPMEKDKAAALAHQDAKARFTKIREALAGKFVTDVNRGGGEVVAYNQRSDRDAGTVVVNEGWKNSPPHWQALMCPGKVLIGVGVVRKEGVSYFTAIVTPIN